VEGHAASDTKEETMAESLDYASPGAKPVKSGMARGILMFAIVRATGFWMFLMADIGREVFANVGTLAAFVGCWLVSPSLGFAAALWILRPRAARHRPRVMGMAAVSALLSYAGLIFYPMFFWRPISPAALHRVVMVIVCEEFFVGFLAGSLVLGAHRIWFDRRLAV
jgi:hypothetical protein